MPLPRYQPFYLHSPDDLYAEIGRLGLGIPLSDDMSVLEGPVSGTLIANRFCAQPVTGLDALPDGSPGPLTRHRYRRLVEGGFGLVWIESTVAGDCAPRGRMRIADDTVEAFREFCGGASGSCRRVRHAGPAACGRCSGGSSVGPCAGSESRWAGGRRRACGRRRIRRSRRAGLPWSAAGGAAGGLRAGGAVRRILREPQPVPA